MTEHREEGPEVPPRISGASAADEPGEMELTHGLGEDLDEAVILGDTGALPAELVPVAKALVSLRERAAAEPIPPMSAELRAQLTAPNVVALRAVRSVRRAVAVAAAAAVAVTGVGVAAAQNRLPAQIQDVVSSTAELVGVDVPRADERGEGRSDEGLEHGRDDSAPNRPDDVEPGYDGVTPGGAIPAVPGGPGEPADPATPPEQAERPDKPDKPDKPETPAPADPVVPEGPPGQDEGTPPSNPQGSSGGSSASGAKGPQGSSGGGPSSPPPSNPNGGGVGTPAAGAPGQNR